MRRLILASACSLVLSALVPAGATDDIVDIPLTFTVQHVNGTEHQPCPADGGTYDIVGSLVAPRALLEHPTDRPVVLLVHGALSPGSFVFRTPGLPAFDLSKQLADRGHAVVVIDRLGFGTSGIPSQGYLSCAAAHATTVHQVVQALRAGSYDAGAATAVAFTEVALAGHSFGAFISEIEATTLGGIDALIVLSFAAEQGTEPETAVTLGRSFGVTCARGGETKWSGEPAGGYAFSWAHEDVPEMFSFDTLDPAIRQPLLDALERDPCSLVWDPPTLAATLDRLGSVTVPVLLVFGEVEHDWREDQGRGHAAFYTGTTDKTLSIIPGASHFLWYGPEPVRTAFTEEVSSWLGARGF